MRLKELAMARPRFGYRRLHVLLQREGCAVNHKRIYRLYWEAELWVRIKRRQKRAAAIRGPAPVPSAPGAMLEHGLCDGPVAGWTGVSGPDRGG